MNRIMKTLLNKHLIKSLKAYEGIYRVISEKLNLTYDGVDCGDDYSHELHFEVHLSEEFISLCSYKINMYLFMRILLLEADILNF